VLSGWVCAPGGCSWVFGVRLAWSSAGGLVSHDGAAVKDFAAPDTPGFASVQRPGQTSDPDGTAAAELLGLLHFAGGFGKPQVDRADLAGQRSSVLSASDRRALRAAGCGWEITMDRAVVTNGETMVVVAMMGTSVRGERNW
jgi:hypothetical protein